MISPDSCNQVVAGNCDVIVGQEHGDDYGNQAEEEEEDEEEDEDGDEDEDGRPEPHHHQEDNKTMQLHPNHTMTDVLTNYLHQFQRHVSDLTYVYQFKLLKDLSKVLKEDKSNLLEGELECNLSKNRYKDILPFSHTRVALGEDPQVPGSCYINANYIRGPSGNPKAYIACQGPLTCTLNDFWRMIWECNVNVIVMACNQYESGKPKCELYWPEQVGASQSYDNIQVSLVKERQICDDFLVRKLLVKFTPRQSQAYNDHDSGHSSSSGSSSCSASSSSPLESSGSQQTDRNNNYPKPPTCKADATSKRNTKVIERVVCQFHYTNRPDHGAPNSVRPILELARLVRQVQPLDDQPILVHCSAGCGRTGTICCVDYVWGLLKRNKIDQNFNLCNIISDMRQQRMAMVQTLEQYILCHKAVAALFIDHLKQMNNRDQGPVFI